MSRSIEEKVEEHYKKEFNDYGIRHFGKTEGINEGINDALKEASSKSGGRGNNYPDIQLLLDDNHSRRIPVMIEAKGGKNKLEKLNKNGEIVQETTYQSDSKSNAKKPHKKGDKNFSAITMYATNGALHYARAILNYSDYDEALIIGINGTTLDENGEVTDPEQKAYYISKKNNMIPKYVEELDKSLILLKQDNVPRLYNIFDNLNLTDAEKRKFKEETENELEIKIKKIHQRIYDNKAVTLSTNQKLYVFIGLIMAGLSTEGIKRLKVDDLSSNDSKDYNDGTIVIEHIKAFLHARHAADDKIVLIISLLEGVFSTRAIWKPNDDVGNKGESVIKNLYRQISSDIIPLLESNLHLDFTGKILNSLSDWVDIGNDPSNDVVLTPGYLTHFMAKLARTNKDSFVWDVAMGSGGFLVSAMDIMIKDAKDNIQDLNKQKNKIKNIKENQLLGIEILPNVYMLAVLNMILMGDGSTHMFNDNSHHIYKSFNFPATVFLLNPPYSDAGKGFNFVEEALSQMTHGYAAILIQENAGSGKGLPYTKRILERNTLLASIHMPSDIFTGKSSVQTAIYLFKVGQPHEKDNLVTFIDMSEDGYTRLARKKSSQAVNLRDTDHAKERYAEVEAILLGKMPKTHYYTADNKKVIRQPISLSGDDWAYSQHHEVDITPTEEDFRNVVAGYLSYKINNLIKEDKNV